MSKFNERLKQLRDEHGLSAGQLAELIGVSKSTLSFFFKDREPSYDKLMKIAYTFNVSLDWLLGYQEYKDNQDISERVASMETDDPAPTVASEQSEEKTFSSDPADLTDELCPSTSGTKEEILANIDRLNIMIRESVRTYTKYMLSFGQEEFEEYLELLFNCEMVAQTTYELMMYFTFYMEKVQYPIIDERADSSMILTTLGFEYSRFCELHPEDRVIAHYKSYVMGRDDI